MCVRLIPLVSGPRPRLRSSRLAEQFPTTRALIAACLPLAFPVDELEQPASWPTGVRSIGKMRARSYRSKFLLHGSPCLQALRSRLAWHGYR